ncbi:hypothetical protein EDC04DRAFT_2882869 [Pisolithus marmoratus]|nr:hypothetical protein EDC04DRAFT_2882869 [Pisolithus marmoratus]
MDPGPSSHCETSEYDPAYEWPGDGERTTVTTWSSLRLLVLQSSILHKHLRVAVLDAYGEAQIGRDHAPVGSAVPRIRLKEMEVSKLHATAYWDKKRREWAVVDMGSKHGTFLQSGRQLDLEPVRLSPPRVASIPRPLCHLDRLIIGSTTFLCHIHEDRKPCVECMSDGQGDVPLDLSSDRRWVRGETRREQLTTLKRALLSRHHEPSDSSLPSSTRPNTTYVDRSARPAPGVQSPRGDSPGSSVPHATPSQAEAPRSPGPLSDNNVGRQLLLKQGWQPGTDVSAHLQVTPLPPRAGLGMPDKTGPPPQSFHQWREDGKERRWESMKSTAS